MKGRSLLRAWPLACEQPGEVEHVDNAVAGDVGGAVAML